MRDKQDNPLEEFYRYKQQQAPKRNYKILLPFAFGCVLLLGIVLGITINKSSGGKDPILGGDYNKIKDVVGLIDEKYVDTVDTEELFSDVLDEMLEELDPHSYYIPPIDLEAIEESMQGEFEGIGIEFYIVEDTITVVSPISGGPSESLGIQAGDKIVIIEDTIVAGTGITNSDVIDKLRGEKGTKVNVGIMRDGEREIIDYEITRDEIPIYSVEAAYMIDQEIGYIKVNQFSGTTYSEFYEAMYELKEKKMTNLILDLRQNPGGYLDEAIAMLDEFIDGDKLLLYTEGRAYDRQDYHAERTGIFEDGRVVVLIDEGSASASEIVAGGIQDWDRGMVLGRRSFGKGLVQEQYNLEDGSALRLTIARYYTPSGRCIQRSYDEGVQAYYDELYDRFKNGEMLSEDSIAVSDTAIFQTASGRIVYAGGGITPDVFVPLDTTANWRYLRSARRFAPEFIYNYYSSNLSEFEEYKSFREFRGEYHISDELYDEFISFAIGKGLDRDDKKIRYIRPNMKAYLKSYVAKQLWGSEGYFPLINESDPDVLRAIEELRRGRHPVF